MKRIRWFSCALSLLAWKNAASFVSRSDDAKNRRRAERRSAILLRQHGNVEEMQRSTILMHENDNVEEKQHRRDVTVPSKTDSYSLNPAALLIPLAVLSFPLIAAAIDHPVDVNLLGIPIPVPDARYFLSGGLCAALSHGVTTPVDVVKTRIQSEPDVFNEGLVSATRTIITQDGAGALLGGLGPTVVGYGIEGAMKFGLYESLKPTFAQFLPQGDVALAYLGASVVAGAAASLLLCPMEHTRIRLVTEPTFANGLVSAIILCFVLRC